MKRNWFNQTVHSTLTFFVLSVVAALLSQPVWATNEMDIDADLLSATTMTPTPLPSPQVSPMVMVPTYTATPSLDIKADENSDEDTPVPGQGVLKMETVYKAGLSYYKDQDFAKAIRYLRKSLDIHDPYTPKFYYAEANAMLGVIYQFHIIDKPTAYYYYRAALDIDPTTATAKKHIDEVSDGETK